MKWDDIVEHYPDKWVVVDNIVEKVVDGVTMIDTVDLIAVFTTAEVADKITSYIEKYPDASVLSTGGTEDELEV